MKATFRQFIREASVGEDLSPKILSEDEALRVIRENCSDVIDLFLQDHNFFKGFSADPLGKSEVFGVIDTNRTTRKSQNTANFYTLVLDYKAKETGFPLRSKSLIGTTYSGTAESYGRRGGKFIMLPFNGSKIGFVGKPDIWEIPVKFMGMKFHTHSVSYFLNNDLGIPDTDISQIEKYQTLMRDKESVEFGKFVYAVTVEYGLFHFPYAVVRGLRNLFPNFSDTDNLGKMGLEIFRNHLTDDQKQHVKDLSSSLVDSVMDVFDHDSLGMKWKSTSNLSSSDMSEESEVWIQGKILMMRVLDHTSHSKFIEKLKGRK